MSGPPPGRGFPRGGGRGGAGSGRGRGRGRGSGNSGPRGRGTFGQHRQPRDSGFGSRQPRSSNPNDTALPTTSNPHGSLCCDYVDENPPSSSAEPSTEPFRCDFRTHSSLALMLHKADRHLIYPEGGVEELKRYDPMHIAEQREQQRRLRQQQRRAPHPLPSRPGAAKPSQHGGDDSSASDDSDEDDSDDDDSAGEDSSSDADEEEDQPKAAEAKERGRMMDGPADATISGLNIQLDSPELIAEWINQRKKRWPTQDVVQQKLKEREERQKRSEMIYGPRPTAYGKRQRDALIPEPASQEGAQTAEAAQNPASQDKRPKLNETEDNTNAPEAVEQVDNGTRDDSDSDDDGAPEEVTSKAPVPSLEEEKAASQSQSTIGTVPLGARQDRRPICTHFLQGRCNYGDRCKKRHETAATASNPGSSSQQQTAKTVRRPHPRPPPANPFEQPDLLRSLLRNEIEKHVDAVGQAIRFIVDNDMLLHVETEEGQAEEQKQRRQQIQVLPSEQNGGSDSASRAADAEAQDGGASSDLPEELPLSKPLVEGGMAVLKSTLATSDAPTKASLYRPTSPTLRALSELKYPPEPDPLIYLDPLGRDDPKPLMPSQLTRIAKDPVIRSVLTPSTPIHPNGHKPASLERAIVSLDALPTDLYRNAAIEMILGIASSNASSSAGSHHNPAGGLVVVSKDGRRKVSETDLFRMGLRVGGDEVLAIKKLADRLSVLLDSSLQLDEVGESDWSLLTKEQRDEMRRLHYDREADRLDKLRKLGIDV